MQNNTNTQVRSLVSIIWILQMTWIGFLGLFTHFLLTELRPVETASEVTVYEWLVLCWVASMTLDEFKQVVMRFCPLSCHFSSSNRTIRDY